MDYVEIYLRTELFTLGGKSGHVPRGAMILRGHVKEQTSGGLVVSVREYLDLKGQPLTGEPRLLLLPVAKIDHLQLLEG